MPFFMRWPGRIPEGTRFAKPVHHFDIFSTAAAAAGASVPTDRPMDGVNLLPYVSESVNKDGDSLKTWNATPHDRLFWRGGHYQVVIADGWKLQRTARPDKVWLFNLERDPTEQHNVADKNPEQVQKMMAMLDEHNATQVDPAWPAMLESPIRIDKTLADQYSADDEYLYWPN